MQPALSYQIFPLGDNALCIDFGNLINETINKKVISLFHQLRRDPFDGIIEVTPAYSSLTIYYNILSVYKNVPKEITVFEWMKAKTERFLEQETVIEPEKENQVTIPVCYDKEFAADIDYVAEQKNISPEEIIRIHTAKTYRVYMLGFLPGFTYMGEVDEQISIPRKPVPQTVAAGSVGIAGRQTGIYPLISPGGWQIIGRTPLKMFDKNNEQCTLVKAGDTVQFISISKDEFENIKSRNS